MDKKIEEEKQEWKDSCIIVRLTIRMFKIPLKT
jgi:hypothetical protein